MTAGTSSDYVYRHSADFKNSVAETVNGYQESQASRRRTTWVPITSNNVILWAVVSQLGDSSVIIQLFVHDSTDSVMLSSVILSAIAWNNSMIAGSLNLANITAYASPIVDASATSASSSSIGVGLIAGVVGGAIAIAVISIILVVVFRRRASSSKQVAKQTRQLLNDLLPIDNPAENVAYDHFELMSTGYAVPSRGDAFDSQVDEFYGTGTSHNDLPIDLDSTVANPLFDHHYSEMDGSTGGSAVYGNLGGTESFTYATGDLHEM